MYDEGLFEAITCKYDFRLYRNYGQSVCVVTFSFTIALVMASAAEGVEYFEDDTAIDLSQFKLPEKIEWAAESTSTHEQDETPIYET